MNIFISVYHLVRNILLFPKNLFEKKKNEKLVEEKRLEDLKRQERNLAEGGVTTPTPSAPVEQIIRDKKEEEKDDLPRITFRYEVVNEFGQTIKSSFDAINENEVRAYLINEGYKIIKIEPVTGINWNLEIGSNKLSTSELTFALTQLSTYIKEGIPLIDSVRILAKQTANPGKRKVFERIVYDLVTGEDFSTALLKQEKVFPRLLINMIKTAEMTGDLPSVLDEMSEYYTRIEKTRKQMLSALIYPAVILVVTIVVLVFCLLFIVPSFVSMYESSDQALPAITTITLAISGFLQNNYIFIILILVFIGVTYYLLFKNVKSFRRMMQSIYMRIPVLGNIIIYSEVSMFTRTFSSLINHNVNITQSMEVLSKISNNEIYKEIIERTVRTLEKGGKISESFRGNWAFPIVAYEMLVTGESTGQLGVMMEKVSEHYDNLHQTSIAAIKSLIEPITIIILAFGVGFILLSMFIPMFGAYNTVG